MNDVNQMAVSRLLQAISTNRSLNTSNSSSSDSSYDFASVLANSLGNYGSLSSLNTTNNCSSSTNSYNILNSIGNINREYESELETFKTLIGSINASKINMSISFDESKEGNKTPKIEISVDKNEEVKESSKVEESNKSSKSSKMGKAIKLLEKQIGKKYVWGSNGPNSFDCSGLTKYIYKEALGKDIPRSSYEQSKCGKAVDRKDLQVGDLVFFDTMNKGRVSHVGIYVGNNEFIHASNPSDGVKKSTLSGYYDKKYICARRP